MLRNKLYYSSKAIDESQRVWLHFAAVILILIPELSICLNYLW